MMPHVDGLSACRMLRQRGSTLPILMLTARHTVSDRVDGLDAGADDYLVKPFAIDELLAVRGAPATAGADGLRRAAPGRGPGARRRDTTRHPSRRDIDLTKLEFDLLELLIRNAGIVLSREVIYERIWGYDFGTGSKSLDVYVGTYAARPRPAASRASSTPCEGLATRCAHHEPQRSAGRRPGARSGGGVEMSLRWRFAIVLALLVAGVVLALSASAWLSARNEIVAGVDDALRRQANDAARGFFVGSPPESSDDRRQGPGPRADPQPAGLDHRGGRRRVPGRRRRPGVAAGTDESILREVTVAGKSSAC